ncbi:MAG: RibD family protein, partial [Clostridiales bacterium]|nr:RibD family protein [Clostridiales bacterium]
LTCRIENGKNPLRIICDTNLRTPLDANIVKTAAKIPTLIATACNDEAKQRPYLERCCDIITLPQDGGHIDLRALMVELGRREIDSVLCEGGGTLNWSALLSGVVNKAQAYIAPKLLGGTGAKTPVMGRGVESPDQAFFLANTRIISLDQDILIEGEVIYNIHRNN